jgi:hypothetical protein
VGGQGFAGIAGPGKRVTVKIAPARIAEIAFGACLIAAVAWFVAGFPILRPWLAAGFALYAVCLWRWPLLWLVAVPALLPVFDLAPWSGRFFFAEFDALVLLTAGTLAIRVHKPQPVVGGPRMLNWILVLLAVSYLCSTAIRIWPPAPITPDSFANYYSPYNSLRVAKGFAWALLLYRPLREAIARKPNARLLLCTGFVAGLAGVAIFALYERWMFPGILTLNTDYRISASFSSMHTGDGHIDVWLATTIPMIAVLLLFRSRPVLLPLAAILLVASLYTLVATQSRGPAIALVIASIAGLLALLTTGKRHGPAAIVTLVCIGAVTMLTASSPGFAKIPFVQRFEDVVPDARIRLDHWRNALALRDDTITARIFGMGLGSFPVLHWLRATKEPRSARYIFAADKTGGFLKMWSGENLYMGQAITIVPHSDYSLTVKLRTAEPKAGVVVLWCELWLLTSQNCTSNSFQPQPSANQWQTLTGTIHAGEAGTAKSLLGMKIPPPARLTFFVSNADHDGVDIGGVSVKDSLGRELVENGNFGEGSDHWFWAEDDHLPWHIKNLAVGVLFEQGWLGVLAVGSLLLYTCAMLGRQIARKDPLSPIFAASLTGFMVTAVTVSTFDAPRLSLMFYLLCFVIIAGSGRTRGELLPVR